MPLCSLTVPDQLLQQKIPLINLATDKAKLSKSVLCPEHRKGGFFIITATFQVSNESSTSEIYFFFKSHTNTDSCISLNDNKMVLIKLKAFFYFSSLSYLVPDLLYSSSILLDYFRDFILCFFMQLFSLSKSKNGPPPPVLLIIYS